MQRSRQSLQSVDSEVGSVGQQLLAALVEVVVGQQHHKKHHKRQFKDQQRAPRANSRPSPLLLYLRFLFLHNLFLVLTCHIEIPTHVLQPFLLFLSPRFLVNAVQRQIAVQVLLRLIEHLLQSNWQRIITLLQSDNIKCRAASRAPVAAESAVATTINPLAHIALLILTATPSLRYGKPSSSPPSSLLPPWAYSLSSTTSTGNSNRGCSRLPTSWKGKFVCSRLSVMSRRSSRLSPLLNDRLLLLICLMEYEGSRVDMVLLAVDTQRIVFYGADLAVDEFSSAELAVVDLDVIVQFSVGELKDLDWSSLLPMSNLHSPQFLGCVQLDPFELLVILPGLPDYHQILVFIYFQEVPASESNLRPFQAELLEVVDSYLTVL